MYYIYMYYMCTTTCWSRSISDIHFFIKRSVSNGGNISIDFLNMNYIIEYARNLIIINYVSFWCIVRLAI